MLPVPCGRGLPCRLLVQQGCAGMLTLLRAELRCGLVRGRTQRGVARCKFLRHIHDLLTTRFCTGVGNLQHQHASSNQSYAAGWHFASSLHWRTHSGPMLMQTAAPSSCSGRALTAIDHDRRGTDFAWAEFIPVIEPRDTRAAEGANLCPCADPAFSPLPSAWLPSVLPQA